MIPMHDHRFVEALHEISTQGFFGSYFLDCACFERIAAAGKSY